MTSDRKSRAIILVVEDVEETRLGIERLLLRDGYTISTAGDEEEAILKASLQVPDLILMSLGFDSARMVAIARSIRHRTGLRADVPVVIFCVLSIAEGAEVDSGSNIYLTRPDNFDQLRAFLSRLL